MGWCEAHVENTDGSRGRTVHKEGEDPLRDDAPRKQIEHEIEVYEDWTNGPKVPEERARQSTRKSSIFLG